MHISQKYFSLLTSLIIIQFCSAQNTKNIWRITPSDRIIQSKGKRPIQPNNFLIYQVNFELLKSHLNNAPNTIEKDKGLKISLPSPLGIKNFIISKTELIPEHLQSPGADIQTFFGYNEAHPNEWISLDYTNHGFHAMITGTDGYDYFIDPYQLNDTENYLVYYKKHNTDTKSFECLLQEEAILDDLNGDEIITSKNIIQNDCKLRTYRLAIACTGEYSIYHGGTQALAQSGIATTINRVNQMLRRDIGVVLTIVSGANIVYQDPMTDPYVNGDIYQMLDTNATVIPDNVGTLNFDIGHVLGTAGLLSGGLATRDGTCQPGDKAGGVTTFEDPIGDQFDIDFVAHELGHQLGARHTFNSTVGACAGWLQRSDLGAYEPGSGSTIMAYAGLCNHPGLSTDVQDMSDALFHSYTISEVSKTLITGNGSQCGTVTSSGNIKPIADAGPVFYNLPINTPFQLTANSTDADNADVHTYTWEQYDLAPSSQNLPSSTSLDQPNFRTYEPSLNKTRYFPTLDSLVENVQWPRFEKIPSVSRNMKFRLTVRDNSNANCGCTDFDEIDLNFSSSAGPFLVTSPNTTGITWASASSQNVTWNPAGTENAPISCSNVDILLSSDGGYTYPYILALNVPNNGNQTITVPNVGTNMARIKIICSDNVFYDISDNDFTITSTPITEPEISFETSLIETFEEDTPDGNLDCRSYKDYLVKMKIANPPNVNATVAINTNGNATNDYDYRILGTPVIFPGGSSSDQDFIVRIIDDGEVDPLENLALSFTITGSSNATYGNTNQTCLIKIHDNEHAPFSGAIPHFIESFNSGVNFGTGNTDWNMANNSGNEVWTLGNGGEISGTGQSIYISDNGVNNSYNTSNSYNYVSIESPEINGVGKSYQVLSFDFISEGDLGHDFGRLAYDAGAGASLIEGGNNAPFVDVNVKTNAVIPLPPAVDGTNYKLTWGWSNSTTNSGGVAGKGFEINNIKITEGTPGIRIETEVTTILDEQYLGPNQSIYFHDPSDGNLLLYIENNSNHDFGCTTVEVDRAGRDATQFQLTDNTYDVTDKSYRVIPTNNSSTASYSITLFYSEEEIAGWEVSTGNSRSEIDIVKSIGSIASVTPATPQTQTTFYEDAILGAFGTDITLTSSYSNGLSGFAAGINEIPLPVELIRFDANIINDMHVELLWSTSTETNNDYFSIEKSTNGVDWEIVGKVNGAGNSSKLLEYSLIDFSPFSGVSYYRLKQTDFNGKSDYSKVRSVNFKDQLVHIYPNATADFLTIEGDSHELNNISVYTTSGQNVTALINIKSKKDASLIIDISALSSGIYFLQTANTINKLCKK